MDTTHLHLILTHFPIVGTIIGTLILAYGIYLKNNQTIKISLLIFIFMAIISVPVFITGEGAEETVEHLPGVYENMIEEHEEFAEKAIWAMGILGIWSLIGFIAIYKKNKFIYKISLFTLLFAFITSGLFIKVGNLGGQIRHSEIRSGNSGNIQGEDYKIKDKKEYKEHDEDDDD